MPHRTRQPDRESAIRRLLRDTGGSTMLEWCLLLAAIALPSYWIISTGLNVLVEHYRLMTMLNSLPFP